MELSNTVALGAFILEAYFHGIYLIIFTCAMYLVKSRQRSNARSTIVLVGCSLCFIFFLATAHMVVSLCRLFLNVVTVPSMSGPYQIYKGNAVGLTLASKILWAAISVISEGMLVWRCWVLWERKFWMIPVFASLEISFVACCIGYSVSASRSANALFDPVTVAWYTSISIMSISVNVLASGLICLRLFLAQTRTVGQAHAVRIRTLFWAYLHSGSIYPTVTVLALGFYFSGSPYGWFLNTISPQICGMMPTLMVIVVLYDGQSLSCDNAARTTDSFSMRPRPSPRSYADHLVASEILPHNELKHSLEVHVRREEHQPTKAISSHIHIIGTYEHT